MENNTGGNPPAKTTAALEAAVHELEKENRALHRKLVIAQNFIDRASALTSTRDKFLDAMAGEKTRQEKYMDLLLANSPDIILLLDAAERFINCTDIFLKRAGIASSGSILDRSFFDVFEPLTDSETAAELQQALQPVIVGGHTQVLNKTLDIAHVGNPRHYSILITPMLEGGRSDGALLLFHDITDIVETMEEAKQASKAKSAFLAQMSHEIRTPLNAILGMAELLIQEEISAPAAQKVSRIQQAGNSLLDIINDILDFSKIESGYMELSPNVFTLSSLLSDVINIVQVRAGEKQLAFTVDVDCSLPDCLFGDEPRIRQILVNLLSNAVKYTRGGFVALRVSGRVDGKRVLLQIEVEDSGIGVRESDYEAIFDTFSQVDLSSNKHIEGTGLGLSISRRLARLMSGDITVRSQYEKGSVFSASMQVYAQSGTPYAHIAQAKDMHLLAYEPNKRYTASLERACAQLLLPCTITADEDALFAAAAARPYTLALVSGRIAPAQMDRLHAHSPAARLFYMLPYGEAVPGASYPAVTLPVHSRTIADLCNGAGEQTRAKARHSRKKPFSAPTARVLLVDDIAINLLVAEGLLSFYHVQCDRCESGYEAIEMVRNTRYDIVFMDHMMPGMDGIEAAHAIRELGEAFQTLPIVALTANALSETQALFAQSGFQDFLAKPIEPEKLNSILERWIPEEKRVYAEAAE